MVLPCSITATAAPGESGLFQSANTASMSFARSVCAPSEVTTAKQIDETRATPARPCISTVIINLPQTHHDVRFVPLIPLQLQWMNCHQQILPVRSGWRSDRLIEMKSPNGSN